MMSLRAAGNVVFFTALLLQPVLVAQPDPSRIGATDFGRYFRQFHVDGSFVLFDLNQAKYIVYNDAQFMRPFTPASTFKICHSLIALETGVIPDENYVIPWDGKIRPHPEWNRDHSLQTAYKYSVVWYYQEIARRVGAQREKYWLDKARYGNADTSGGLTAFWLFGGLRITPEQQIDFLRRLYENQLPFSRRSMDIVRKIMIAEETPSYVLRAKTGWSEQDSLSIGWYVGYVQKNDDVYFFATCIQSPHPDEATFGDARIAITRAILKELRIL